MTSDHAMDAVARSRAEIERTIDDLDMALAAGKIDLETHRQLQTKWRQKLQTVLAPFQSQTAVVPDEPAFFSRPRAAAMPAPVIHPDMAALTSTMVNTVQGLVDQLPRQQGGPPRGATARKVACPDCGAPVVTMPAPGLPVRCAYCDATFTLEKAESEDNHLQDELRRWLDSMVAVGAAGGSVDAASRHFIFTERLFPSLSLEVSRHLESFEALRGAPLCVFQGSRLFGDRRMLPPAAVDTTVLRRLVARLDAAEVRSFAITADDRARLDDLAIRSMLVLRLGTTLRQLAQGSAAGYRTAQRNVEAVAGILQTAAADAGPAQAQFYLASAARLAASASVLGILARLHDAGGIPVSEALAGLQTAVAGLAAAQRQLAASGYAPVDVISTQRGLRADREQARLLQRLLAVYDVAGVAIGEPLPRFAQRLDQFADAVGLHPATATEVDEFLGALLAWAGQGDLPIATVNEWDWLPAAIDSTRKRTGLFGREERVAEQQLYWHPFHCFPVHFSVVKGSLFKGGVEEDGYVLVSAIGRADPVFAATQQPLYVAIERAAPGLPLDSLPQPLPLRALSESRQAAERRCLTDPSIRNPRLGAPRIVLLPACFAGLEAGDNRREVNLTVCGPRAGEAHGVIEAMAQLRGGP